jgi:acetyl esterase
MLDPALFSPRAIDPETAAFNAELERQLAAFPPLYNFPPQLIRQARESGQGPFGPVVYADWAEERSIPGPAGTLPLRVFIPKKRIAGVYLHLHGGGFTIGSARQQDPLLAAIATHCAVAVVSVDYRLAPEQPYPAGPDDCEAAALWLVKPSPSRSAGGQSTGS